MSAYATVACDGESTPIGRCMSEDTLPYLTSTATQVRAYLKQQGWHRTRGGRDICPDCWKAGHR